MVIAMQHRHNDGGRQAAGYTGSAGDCVCRAIAIATQQPYQVVYDALVALGKKERTGKRKRGRSHPRTGVYKQATRKYMAALGWHWKATMHIGSGCTVHLKTSELPAGRLMVSLSRHHAAVVDGVLHDTYDCTRDGTRCVYGYYYQ